jgi:hypothetical protein
MTGDATPRCLAHKKKPKPTLTMISVKSPTWVLVPLARFSRL